MQNWNFFWFICNNLWYIRGIFWQWKFLAGITNTYMHLKKASYQGKHAEGSMETQSTWYGQKDTCYQISTFISKCRLYLIYKRKRFKILEWGNFKVSVNLTNLSIPCRFRKTHLKGTNNLPIVIWYDECISTNQNVLLAQFLAMNLFFLSSIFIWTIYSCSKCAACCVPRRIWADSVSSIGTNNTGQYRRDWSMH